MSAALALIAGQWQRIVIYAVLVLAVLGLVWAHGYERGGRRLLEYQAKEATQAVAVARGRDIVTERVVNRYIRVAGVTSTIMQTIDKEAVRYGQANPGYCLDVRWGELHDAAAEDILPPTAGDPDGAARAPTAAGALEAVTENYGACHRNAERLEALQQWVHEQHGVEE